MRDSVTWKIGGEAGFGIMSAGTMLAKIFARSGYHTFAINEYPSLIRGGHNLITVRIATHKFESMNKDLHILAALNRETIELHKNELSDGAYILVDPKDIGTDSEFPNGVKTLQIPILEITAQFHGEPVMHNTVMIGATLALTGMDFAPLEKLLTDQFSRKGEEVVKLNVSIARGGYDHVKNTYPDAASMNLNQAAARGKQLIVNGSEVLGIAAVRAGLKFAAIYPMTPINSVISFLADHAKQFGLVYKQPEDEIAGINMAIGASVAGVRSMVATSGGGFALMVEGVSLAGMMETPLVIDLGMRAGPATGMPTWTEQGELRMAIHAGHGEFARVVLAPGDAEETFALTVEAFHLADKYQIPVFILTDKYLNESQWCVQSEVISVPVTIDRGKLLAAETVAKIVDYKRYDVNTDDGVSPRSLPGMPGGIYVSNSYEHEEHGHVTDDALGRQKMSDKRLKKLQSIQSIARAPTLYGNPKSDITFVSWGTNKGPILEAIQLLDRDGISASLIHYTWIFPFPEDASIKLLGEAKKLVDVELNGTAQLAGLIREHTGIKIEHKILKYTGRQFYPEEIVERYKKL